MRNDYIIILYSNLCTILNYFNKFYEILTRETIKWMLLNVVEAYITGFQSLNEYRLWDEGISS